VKITAVRLETVRVPLPRPIPSLGITISHTQCLLAFVETDEGLVGEGLVFTLNGERFGVVREMAESLVPLLVGLDPTMSTGFWQRAWSGMHFLGHRGATMVGLAVLDMALWDLRGKQAGLNVSRLIGACRDSVPIYRSGGLRLSLSIDELQKEAAEFRAAGFRAMKMSLGKPTAREDAARVRAVREAIGDDIALMADCNQRFTVPQAIRLGRMLEEFRLDWIEEPVQAHNHAGEAAVAAALDTPVASGESEWTRLGMQEMLRLRSADILMPDLQRMGGPTELLRAATLAEVHDVPVSPHLFSEMSLALAAAIPNSAPIEYMPWFAPLYAGGIALDDAGQAVVPTASGWGFAFDPRAVARFRI
jgi:L-alanine-DL-glutamate epimerase-like enolase superfamily enzyme